MTRARAAIATRIERTGDAQVDRIQQSSADVAAALRTCPFLRGRLISVTFAFATNKVITHNLGVPAACFIIRPNYSGSGSGVSIAESASQAGLDPRTQLSLIATLACDVDLWFYPRASRPIDARSGVST